MVPSRALWKAMQDLLAADTASLAAATAMHIHLAAANFTPGLDLVLATLTEATFTGSTPLNAGTGAQTVFYDAVTGFSVIELLEPAGGWHWTCTVTPAPAETIYGWYVTDTANAVLWGCGKLLNPVTINAAGQGLDIPNIKLSFLTNSPF